MYICWWWWKYSVTSALPAVAFIRSKTTMRTRRGAVKEHCQTDTDRQTDRPVLYYIQMIRPVPYKSLVSRKTILCFSSPGQSWFWIFASHYYAPWPFFVCLAMCGFDCVRVDVWCVCEKIQFISKLMPSQCHVIPLVIFFLLGRIIICPFQSLLLLLLLLLYMSFNDLLGGSDYFPDLWSIELHWFLLCSNCTCSSWSFASLLLFASCPFLLCGS